MVNPGQPENFDLSGQRRSFRPVDGIFVPKKNLIKPTPNLSLPSKAIPQPSKPKPLPPPVLPAKIEPQIITSLPKTSENLPVTPTPPEPFLPLPTSQPPEFFEMPLEEEYVRDKREYSSIFKRIAFSSVLAVLATAMILSGGFLLKNRDTLIQKAAADSETGKNYLELAQKSLLAMDFNTANKDFTSAFEEFNKVEKNLSSLGQSNVLLNQLPQNKSTMISSQKLVSVAEDLSYAGKEMTGSMNLFNNFSLLDQKEISSWYPFEQSKNNLDSANDALKRAQNNLNFVDPKAIPGSEAMLNELKVKLPVFIDFSKTISDTVAELPQILGKGQLQKYLVLFQNPAEARATGGFLGNFGKLSFSNGKMIGPEVDDIYKLKWAVWGKKENLEPPQEVLDAKISLWQHGEWPLWDANWWIDFPTTAKKMEWYYEYYGQGLTDGVIAIDPQVFAEILKIVGPIRMKNYGVTINSRNFWQVMERKVEVDNPFKKGQAKYNEANPKQILKDFAPQLMAKVKKASRDQKLAMVKSIYENLQRKHILLFANNQNLGEVFAKLNWNGQVRSDFDDYLTVNETNIGVNKSSLRVSQKFDLNIEVKPEEVIHHLKIIRTHHGQPGNPLTGRNISYQRILVPKGASLSSITLDGQDIASRVILGEESGKTKFGFTVKLKPKKTQVIEINYIVPLKIEATSLTPKNYQLYFQKQPGRIKDLVDVNVNVDPGFKIKGIGSAAGGNFTGQKVEFSSDLLEDRIFSILLGR